MKVVAGMLVASAVFWSPSVHALPASFYSDPTPRPVGAVALVGDSTSYAYFDGLPASFVDEGWGPFQLEVRSARRTLVTSSIATSGIDAVRRIRAGGFDPAVWIIALGTNDINVVSRTPGAATALINAMLDEIGADHRVVWVNIYSQFDPVTSVAFNDALDDVAASGDQLRVIDWHSLASTHPDWFNPDGIHNTLTGAIARNAFVADAAVAAIATRCLPVAAPTPPTPASAVDAVNAATASKPAVRLCAPV
ncbi:MAG: GDSL-type esterase/lipase family protein [Ilumatobacteraceae bacterium]